jgi:hypothetical protein
VRQALPLFLAACIALIAQPAFAHDSWDEGVELISESEMDALRGGFAVGSGIEIQFGAQITTLVNGVPALTTNLTWSNTGQLVSDTIGQIGQSIEHLTSEQRAELGLDGLESAGGVVIEDADGVTALVHNITQGALQNIIVNSATGRDLRQEIDLTLTLPGFEAVQQSLQLERIGIRLDADLRGVIIGGP